MAARGEIDKTLGKLEESINGINRSMRDMNKRFDKIDDTMEKILINVQETDTKATVTATNLENHIKYSWKTATYLAVIFLAVGMIGGLLGYIYGSDTKQNNERAKTSIQSSVEGSN